MHPGLDAILFDLDDTLCRYRRSSADLLAAAADRTGLDSFVTAPEYHDRYPEYVDDSDSITDLRERCFAAIAESKNRDPADGVRLARAYAAERDHGNVEPIPGAEAVLSSASELPVGVVTNGAPEMQRRKLESLGFEDAFDTIVYAGYDSPAKPDPGPFEVALSALDAHADRTVHVGNSLETDVAGAVGAGVRAVWLRSEAAPGSSESLPKPDHELSALAELPAIFDDGRKRE